MKKILSVFVIFILAHQLNAQSIGAELKLSSDKLKILWEKKSDGWHIKSIEAGGKNLPNPAGYYNILYLNRNPAQNLVEQDLEGKDFTFYPSSAIQYADDSIIFKRSLRVADIEAVWKIDPASPTDIRVNIRLTAKESGSVSIATPTIATIDPKDLAWGMIPGNWYGTEIQRNIQLAKQYSMGVPAVPLLAKEQNTMTLCPLISTRDEMTLAVIPDPGTAADPWEYDQSTRGQNKVGMSIMNRHNELTPIAYAPVLGQVGSKIKAGDSVSFSFRYSIQASKWFAVFSHVVTDIYKLPYLLDIQQSNMSLSERVGRLQTYLRNDKKSAWKTWESRGYKIGANGAKIADAGTMWMIAKSGKDSVMESRLPYVRNYKLAQQQTEAGFFQGAALGEYADEDGVESERGNWIEPIHTTYYTMVDLGNILLFQPNDNELRGRLRLAAEKLMAWQHEDGSFDVGYDRFSYKSTFPDLIDYRPTWYGFLIAYRILGDSKYLAAAEKGAKWLIENGVNKGYYLGVCGDARNIWDFATAQCSQAYVELYETTREEPYKKAAIDAASAYSTSIFTHPIASIKDKLVNGVVRKDWEINQVGLSVEHIRGTASGGPVLISSFAGLFTRIYEYTGEQLFLTMARGAARGRNAYVDPESGQSIYYWNNFTNIEKGATMFPWHAYWQIGWITDYLISEAHLRSNGKVQFPGGFMTPKVGPHITYGFAPGTIFGSKANLIYRPGMLKSENPDLEYLTALSENGKQLFLMVLNQSPQESSGSFSIDLSYLTFKAKWTNEQIIQGPTPVANRSKGKLSMKIPAWGMNVIELNLENLKK